MKDIGDSNQKVGEAVSGGSAQVGAAAADGELKKVLTAFKGIVEIAKKQQVDEPTKSDVAISAANIGDSTPQDGAKILSTNNTGGNPGAGDVAKAAAILASVSGKEILAAIINSKDSDADSGVSTNATDQTSALAFAKGGQTGHVSNTANVKASAVAGGIALRSLVKNGTLAKGAGDTATGGGKEVQGVGITAVNKLLGAIEDVIKKTVKNVLGTAKQKINEARAPKSEGQK